MDERIDLITDLCARFPGANAGSPTAEKERIKFLVADTESLPLDVLRTAIRDGVKAWKFMPTAAEIFEAAQDDMRHRRDMARLAYVAPLARALPAPPAAPPNDEQLAAMNEWGRPLGMSWDSNGVMTRVAPVNAKARPIEERAAATEHPKAADYAEMRAMVNAAAPPVSDASPALRALRERMMQA